MNARILDMHSTLKGAEQFLVATLFVGDTTSLEESERMSQRIMKELLKARKRKSEGMLFVNRYTSHYTTEVCIQIYNEVDKDDKAYLNM